MIQDTYRELVRFLVDSQTDSANRERLVEAFEELTRNIPFTADRINRIRDDGEKERVACVQGGPIKLIST